MNKLTRITVLSDNTKSEYCEGEHGLSLYIEHDGLRILLDAGRSSLFYENAKVLGIDLADVDIAVLSHSHYDHADGFDKFFEINSKAKLYVRQEVSESYYSEHDDGMAYIGPRKGMLQEYADRIVYVDSKAYDIDGKGIILIPHSKQGLSKIGERCKLYKMVSDELVPDDFAHEQSLVLYTKQGMIILNSCSHGGPDNILKEVRRFDSKSNIYAYIGGFHLFKSSDDTINEFVNTLKIVAPSKVITGHCTGDHAYEIIRDNLGERAMRMHAGMVIEL